jgi:protein involved in ribonucleotide reduction
MTKADTPVQTEPFVILLPTYGGGSEGKSVPQQVKKFLDVPGNAALLRGVIGSGNTNFGKDYCRAAKIISARFAIPLLYTFEIFGTPDDHEAVHEGLESFWKTQPSSL